MWFSRFISEWVEALNFAIGSAIVGLGAYFGYRTAFWAGENLTFGAGLGFVGGLLLAALVCGIIANLSLIEQHLALIADDIDDIREMEEAEAEENRA